MRTDTHSSALLCIPLGRGQVLAGSRSQLVQLQTYLDSLTLSSGPNRPIRIPLWDRQVLDLPGSQLPALVAGLAALTRPPESARYPAPAQTFAQVAPGGETRPVRADLVTQTLNARGTTGGLRPPAPADARPADPGSTRISSAAQPYLAQICHADASSSWGWTPREPVYTDQASHILVGAVRIALSYRLLLTADQMLALRWVRSPGWTCYIPADLLNAWSLHLAGCLAGQATLDTHPTTQLSR